MKNNIFLIVILLLLSSCFANEESDHLRKLLGFWVPIKNGYDVEYISFVEFDHKYYFRAYIANRPVEDGVVYYTNKVYMIINEDNSSTNVYYQYKIITNVLFFHRNDGVIEVYKKYEN